MSKFKKTIFRMSLLLVAGVVGMFIVHSTTLLAQTHDGRNQEITIIDENDSSRTITVNDGENVTVAILKETLKGSTDEEIDTYFAYYESDAQRILADEYGGLMSIAVGYEGDGDLGYVVNNDGTETHYNLFSPESTTVGEAKQALKTANN